MSEKLLYSVLGVAVAAWVGMAIVSNTEKQTTDKPSSVSAPNTVVIAGMEFKLNKRGIAYHVLPDGYPCYLVLDKNGKAYVSDRGCVGCLIRGEDMMRRGGQQLHEICYTREP